MLLWAAVCLQAGCSEEGSAMGCGGASGHEFRAAPPHPPMRSVHQAVHLTHRDVLACLRLCEGPRGMPGPQDML